MSDSFSDRSAGAFNGRKPGPDPSRMVLDQRALIVYGLRSLFLFDPTMRDIAAPSRTVTRFGQAITNSGPLGPQGYTVAASDAPRFALSPAESSGANRITVSVLALFGGSIPTAGAVLATDAAGNIPLLVGSDGILKMSVAGTDYPFTSVVDATTLLVTDLSGWHRLTAVCDATTNVSTLYVDGGATWKGTVAHSVASFGLNAILGSASRIGAQWPWPAVDFFYWDRSLTADQVSGHTVQPYLAVDARLPDRWITTAAATPPVQQGPTLAGRGTFLADARIVLAAGAVSANIGGAGFVQLAQSIQRLQASATIGGAGAIAVDTDTAHITSLISGQGAVTANTVRRLIGLVIIRSLNPLTDDLGNVITDDQGNPIMISEGGGQVSADARVVGGVRALLAGDGTAIGNPVLSRPFNSALASLAGSGAVLAQATIKAGIQRLATLGGEGGVTVVDARLISVRRARATLNGLGGVLAGVSKISPILRPGFSANGLPQFFTLDVETYVPGAPPVMADKAHGTRPHGTLSRSIAGTLERTGHILASDWGYRTAPDDPGGPVPYPPRLVEGFQIDSRLEVDPARVSAAAAWGTAVLSNADHSLDGIIAEQNSDGRPVRINIGTKRFDLARQYITDPSVGALTPAFVGLAGPWALSDQGLAIPLRDSTYWAERSLQNVVYLGTGGLNGTADMAGRPLPKARGGTFTSPISNVTPTLVDPVNRIYQVSDTDVVIPTVYEGGAPVITYAGDVPDLYNGTTPSGFYRTDNARGLFQIGAKPVAAITCDVVGAFELAGFQSNPFMVAYYLLREDVRVPAEALDFDSFSYAATFYSAMIGGWYFGSDVAVTGIEAIDALLTGLGANVVPWRSDGKLRLLLLRAINSAEPIDATLDSSVIKRVVPRALTATLDPPPYRFRVGYQRNHTVQTSGLNQTILPTDLRAQFLGSADRWQTWIEPTAQAAYRRPNDPPPMPTQLLRDSDALQIAFDHGALWGFRRQIYDITVPRRAVPNHELGKVMAVRYPQIRQLADGVSARVVGYSMRTSSSETILSMLV